MNALRLSSLLPLATFNESWSAATEVFQRGGIVMWPLLICSVLGLAVTIERTLVFWRLKKRSQAAAATIKAMLTRLQQGQAESAIELGSSPAGGPVGRLLAEGLRMRDFGLSESLQAEGNHLLDTLRRGFSLLDTIVTLGPMLGILGTVTGIISSFHLLSTAGVSDPTAVTGGIAEALLTTAAGLIVAIGALIPFNLFTSILRHHARDLEQTIHQCEIAYRQGASEAVEKPRAGRDTHGA